MLRDPVDFSAATACQSSVVYSESYKQIAEEKPLCSRCAKCRSLVEHDTNLLLLSDGSPVLVQLTQTRSLC
jgi:hypothetical protein